MSLTLASANVAMPLWQAAAAFTMLTASVAPDAGQTTSKPKPVRVKHRAVLEGLPPSFTWKELKDEMRRIGRILYADIDEHGDGIVDFESADDLDYAVRVINGSMLDGAVIRVRRVMLMTGSLYRRGPHTRPVRDATKPRRATRRGFVVLSQPVRCSHTG